MLTYFIHTDSGSQDGGIHPESIYIHADGRAKYRDISHKLLSQLIVPGAFYFLLMLIVLTLIILLTLILSTMKSCNA